MTSSSPDRLQFAVGTSASLAKTITEADVLMFGAVSMDFNPAHFDEAYAVGTQFKGRIAHGMLSAGLISAVLGTKLPGPGTIYVSQNLQFKAPVRIGDTVTAMVTIDRLEPKRKRIGLRTICSVADRAVVDGSCEMMVPQGFDEAPPVGAA